MKTTARRFGMMMVAAMGLLLACLTCTGQAHALTADDITLENASGTIHLYPQKDLYGYCYELCLNSDDEFTEEKPKNVKLSNKKCSRYAAEGFIDVEWVTPTSGTTTLTYDWRGVKHTLKMVVHKVKCVKSFKIGGKQYAKKFTKSDVAKTNKKAYISGKVKVKAAKGWKVKSIYAISNNGKTKKIKNNSRIKTSKKVVCVMVTFKNKKTGDTYEVEVANKRFDGYYD